MLKRTELSPITETVLPDAQHIDDEVGPEDIREGDVVFAARPSALQELCTRAGEPWRHVGMATIRDGHPHIVEVSGSSFGLRSMDQVVERSTAVGLARLSLENRPYAEKATAWCVAHAGLQQTYAWDDTILAGFITTTRRYCLPEDRAWLESVIVKALEGYNFDPRIRPATVDADGRSVFSYTCSAFVVAAFLDSGLPFAFDIGQPRGRGDRLSLWEIVRPRARPLRYANGDRISTGQASNVIRSMVRGVVAATNRSPVGADISNRYRWVTPGDIWRSSSFDQRFLLHG